MRAPDSPTGDPRQPAPNPAPDALRPAAGAPGGYTVRQTPVATPTGRRRVPVLALSIALVAVLAGGALFLAGWSVGSRQGAAPGRPAGGGGALAPCCAGDTLV